jgi:hypothetical protein
MIRDSEKFNKSLEFHHKMQLEHFEDARERQVDNMIEWANKHENDKAYTVYRQIDKMKFIFNKSVCLINYGRCSKLDKDVTFIPGICQIETQNCFEHRKG